MPGLKEYIKASFEIVKTHVPKFFSYYKKSVKKNTFDFYNEDNIKINSYKIEFDNNGLSSYFFENEIKEETFLNIYRFDVIKENFVFNKKVTYLYDDLFNEEYFKNKIDKYSKIDKYIKYNKINDINVKEFNSDKEKNYLFNDFKINLNIGNKKDSIGIFIENSDNFKIIGLGEKFSKIVRNKKVFENFTQDQYYHTFYTDNLYSAQNLFYLIGKDCYFLVNINFPGKIIYDFNKSNKNFIGIEIFGKNFLIDIYASNNFKLLIKYLYKIINIKDIPPLAIFGNSHSRWGFKDIDELNNIVEMFNKNDIPIDNIFLDIDYMDNYKIFTVNNINFKDLKNFIDSNIKKESINFVPIMDVGIKKEREYKVYEKFYNNNALVLKNNDEIFEGEVWPGTSVFPDFFNSSGYILWKEFVKEFINKYNIIGFWNDMNEVSVFNTKTRNFTDDVVFNCDESFENDYVINENENHNYENEKHNKDYEKKINDNNNKEKDLKFDKYKNIEVHNLYNYLQNKSSYDAFIETDKRPLIISRADYSYMGKYAGTWTGDNTANYKNLKIGYSQIINYNIIGVPFCGTDIGGFIGDPDDKLLVKWYKNALFHPLFRNHSSKFSKRREPYLFKDETKEKLRELIYLRERFSLLLYNQFFKMYLYNEPPIKPLFYYYQEYELFENDRQFFIEKNVMHILDYSKKELGKINTYFPEGKWINYFTDEEIESNGDFISIYSNWYLPDLWINIPAIFVTSNFRKRVLKDIFPVIEIYPENNYSDKNIESNGMEYRFYEDDFYTNNYKKNIYNEYYVKSDIKINKYFNVNVDFTKKGNYNSKFDYFTFKIHFYHFDEFNLVGVGNNQNDKNNILNKLKVFINKKEIFANNDIKLIERFGFMEPDYESLKIVNKEIKEPFYYFDINDLNLFIFYPADMIK